MTGAAGSAHDLLAAIVAAARVRAREAERRLPLAELERRIARADAPRGFRDSLGQPGLRVIAECKRRSPSRGVLREVYDPVAIASGYARGGAAAVSVLTEPAFFDGQLAHLESVRRTVALPLLRKDFIVSPYQVVEARAAGADAVLLIVAALDAAVLAELLAAAAAAGLDALVEVHDEAELDRAAAAGATLVGVNNRNLRTLEVDLDASRRLVSRMPAGVLAVAESGLRTRADLEQLHAIGYGAFLMGERLMTTPDPGEALGELLADGVVQ